MPKTKPYERPSWDEYFLEVMHALSKRATCDRGRTACVLVKDNQIICSGYVGSPPGFPHCDEVGHLLKVVIDEDGHQSTHCMRTIHAEQNAIIQAGQDRCKGATMYIWGHDFICILCKRFIVQSGITHVYLRKNENSLVKSISVEDIKKEL